MADFYLSRDPSTAKAHNAQLTAKPPADIPDSLRREIAIACKRLENDMWDRLKRHADIADFRVVIDRAIEEFWR